ncbi:Gp138 family membrane-puncturing spike protein [Ignatzschineria larvae]|nr:Gp138 family membrane-puncturing spike protein [Ignatzschineria larvae]
MNDSLYDLLINTIRSEQADFYTALPAKVISFNGHTVTCEVMINRIDENGKDLVIPPLVDVPVQFPRAGGFCMTVPISSGDEGLVIFASRCIDGWYQSGGKGKPLDNRVNDLSDGFFIPGVNSVPNKIPEFFSGGASIQTDDGSTYLRVTNGKILIKGDIEHEGNSKQEGNSEQIGNQDVLGSFTQSGGDGATFGGSVSAQKVTANGVDLETHIHTDSIGGDTTPPK